MAQVPAHQSTDPPSVASSSSSQQSSYVTSEQFSAMSDKWAEQFARMEALLSIYFQHRFLLLNLLTHSL